MEKTPYIELAECLLPKEMVEYFEVVRVEKTADTLDVTLEEPDNGVDGYEAGQLRPNGFHQESVVRDYPVRGGARCRSTSDIADGLRLRQAGVSAGNEVW